MDWQLSEPVPDDEGTWWIGMANGTPISSDSRNEWVDDRWEFLEAVVRRHPPGGVAVTSDPLTFAPQFVTTSGGDLWVAGQEGKWETVTLVALDPESLHERGRWELDLKHLYPPNPSPDECARLRLLASLSDQTLGLLVTPPIAAPPNNGRGTSYATQATWLVFDPASGTVVKEVPIGESMYCAYHSLALEGQTLWLETQTLRGNELMQFDLATGQDLVTIPRAQRGWHYGTSPSPPPDGYYGSSMALRQRRLTPRPFEIVVERYDALHYTSWRSWRQVPLAAQRRVLHATVYVRDVGLESTEQAVWGRLAHLRRVEAIHRVSTQVPLKWVPLTGDIALVQRYMEQRSINFEDALMLQDLDGERLFVMQGVYPTPATLNDGHGVLRLGSIGASDTAVAWHGWIPLPPCASPGWTAPIRVRIFAEPESWVVMLEGTNAAPERDKDGNWRFGRWRGWGRIPVPPGITVLGAPRWLDDPLPPPASAPTLPTPQPPATLAP